MKGVLKNERVLPLRCCHTPLKATPWQQLRVTPSFFNRLMKELFLLPIVQRFIAGEVLPKALQVVGRLNAQGFRTTLDLLGESVSNHEEALQSVEEYIEIIRALHKRGLDRNISIKLTQIGLDIDTAFCRDNLLKIVKEANAIGGFVRVDMESSQYTSRTIDLVEEVHRTFPEVGTVLQASLRRTPEDALRLIEKRIRIRLCKGAYKEPIEIALPDKRSVDKQYLAVMKRLLESEIYHGIATHDDKIIEEAIQFTRKEKISKGTFEFQMLYGIRNRFAKALVQKGWNVRIYVPYGKAWLPYTFRRLRERKENLWFVLKNLFRG